jgi:hypothetical protein
MLVFGCQPIDRQVPTPSSQILEVEQQIQFFGIAKS